MSIFDKKDGKNKLPLSFYVKIISFFVLIGISAVAMQPFQNAISQAMYNVRNDFINNLEILTKLKIQYSSIRPTIFGTIDIRNLKFLNEEQLVFTVSRIKINFSLVELILQKNVFIHTVQIEKPEFNIDTQRDKQSLDFFSSLLKNDNERERTESEKMSMEKISQFLPRDANYQIRNGSFFLADKDLRYDLKDLNFNIREEEDEVFIDGNITAELMYSGLAEKTIIMNTQIGVHGITSGDLQGSADVDFSHITFSQISEVNKNPSFFRPPVNSAKAENLFTVLPFNIRAHYRNNELYSVKPNSNNSIAYNVRYNTVREFFFIDFNLNDFKLSDVLSLSDNYNTTSHLLDINMNGSASLSYDQISKYINYTADLYGGDINTDELEDAFKIIAIGDNEKIEINDFLLSVSPDTAKAGFFQGKIGVSGEIGFFPFNPDASLFLDSVSFAGNETISAVFQASAGRNEVQITSEEIKIAGTSFYDLIALLYPLEKETAINASCFNSDTGSVFFDAVLDNNFKEFEATLSVDSLSFFDITEMARPFTQFIAIPFFSRSYLQESLVSADFFFSTDFNNLVFNAPNINFNAGDYSGNISLSGTDRQFTISEGLITINENDFLLSAEMIFSNPMDLIFSFNANYMDIAWQVEGQILDRTTLIVHDPNGLHVYGNVSNNGAMSGYAEGINYPLPFGGKTLYLNFYGALRYDSVDFWNFNFNNFSAVYDNEEVLKINIIADQNGAVFKEILYSDSFGVLSGRADFTWNIGFTDIGFKFNADDGIEDGEIYFLEGSYINKKININASAADVHINRFTGTDNLILLSADMDASWDSIDLFNAQIDIKSFDAYIDSDPVSASVLLFLSDEELLLNDLKIKFSGMNAAVPYLLFNRSEGIAKANIEIDGHVKKKYMEGQINIDANFYSIDSWLDIKNILNKIDGKVSLENVTFGKYSHEEIVFDFSADEGALSVYGGIDNMLRLEKESSGYFYAGLSSPSPIVAAISGNYNNGNIIAYCNNFFIDIELLYSLTAVESDFNISGGYITGNMEFRGPFWNPEFYGSGTATGMCFQVSEFVTNDIRAVPFGITAQGREMTFDDVLIASGSGSGRTDGWFHFLNWVPVSIGLDISISEELPVPYGINISGFTANGNASGGLNMIFDTRNMTMELTGDLFTNTTELGINFDLFNAGENAPEAAMNSVIDLKITTGSMVEFIWPSTNPIIRANPEMGTEIFISSDTLAGIFTIDSNVNIRSGELNYFNRSFYIRQGRILLRENETQFDPIISARAEIRERSDSGNVTISMTVDNQPLLRFIPTFSANPSLTLLEIYTILGQNQGSIAGADNLDAAEMFLINSGTDFITQVIADSPAMSQLMNFRQMERQVRNALRLDMFSVRTRFLNNAVMSSVAGMRQENTEERNTGLGNYFDNTTVFIGKYIGQDMFIQGMLTLKYDENSNTFGGLVLEPDIGIELQSPFLNIRWDFFPYHPENWWVSDNSITLSWSKSF